MSLTSNMMDTGKLWHGCDIACVVVALRASLDMQLQKLEEDGEDSVKVLCADTFEATGGKAHLDDPTIMYSLPRATLRALDYIMAQVQGGKPWSKYDYKCGKEVLDDFDSRIGYKPLDDDKLMEIHGADGYTADEEGEDEADDEEGEDEASQQNSDEELDDVGEPDDDDDGDYDQEKSASSSSESEAAEEEEEDDDAEEKDSSFGGGAPSARKRAQGSSKSSPSKKAKL